MYWMKPILERLWKDESGISSVEYVMLLAMIAGGIVVSAGFLSNAVSNQLNESAAWLIDDGGGGGGGDSCGNGGGGDGTGGDGGGGQGGDNTC